ncbi:hypothetical protein CEXT_126731 [Caerostris extrusa]|uniref:Uncharacterized protein n=1 Tax=Caerostris extrusa TaxID=172846 RepID=A0AAV4Y7W3_CAEEX|nr:hypothetical protein CEXT_126731 [Caerostris extrusa]
MLSSKVVGLSDRITDETWSSPSPLKGMVASNFISLVTNNHATSGLKNLILKCPHLVHLVEEFVEYLVGG